MLGVGGGWNRDGVIHNDTGVCRTPQPYPPAPPYSSQSSLSLSFFVWK